MDVGQQPGIEWTRIATLRADRQATGSHVLYWMQSAQRTKGNQALAYAIHKANELGLPLQVVFCLTPGYPGASSRHYRFILEGLDDVAIELDRRGISFQIEIGDPTTVVARRCAEAAMLVIDRGYMPNLVDWYQSVVGLVECPVVQVETNVIVPVDVATQKQEYAARTIRKKLMSRLREFLVPVSLPEIVERSKPKAEARRPDIERLLSACGAPSLDASRRTCIGGETQAHRQLDNFVGNQLVAYKSQSRDPAKDAGSHLSAYLHYGQISPISIALAVVSRGGPSADAYIEQLLVRRELAINYVVHCPSAGTFAGLPDWCVTTLQEHAGDPRAYVYSLNQLENAATHDVYWNAAQRELLLTGSMHGYMRMYWGKKILEWSDSPQEAFDRALYLNDKYHLDGRDPNGIVGVAWCFGLHDQPFKERPILGKIRPMGARGLDRKFDMSAYVARIAALERESDER